MSEADRDRLIAAYFDAMDADDLELVRDALGEGFVYESLAGDLEGFEGLETYMDELRGFSDTAHDLHRTIHDPAASVVEGTVSGDLDGEAVSVDFCNVFEFDDADEGITRIGVFTNAS